MKYDNVGLGKFTGVNDSIYASHHPRVKIPAIKSGDGWVGTWSYQLRVGGEQGGGQVAR